MRFAAVRRLVLPAMVCMQAGWLHAQRPPIQITADLTEGARNLYHAEIDLPVSSGPASFVTPLWIPGTHAPVGPIAEITGVVFTANGKVLPWRRDDVHLEEFHVDVPRGVTVLHAHLDCVMSHRVTPKMAVLEWEALMLYPAHVPVRDLAIQPSVTVPAQWKTATALKPIGPVATPAVTGTDEGLHRPSAGAVTTQYAVTTVEQLEDSPVFTGAYLREYPLAPEISPRHYLDVMADEPEDINLRPQFLLAANNLVREADKNYASHHYLEYHFLLTLSDIAGGEGLEHGQSSDNGVGEKDYADDVHQLGDADLLAHEFTHSWNGKYRRPARLYQPDFSTPQQGDLMWVYEGMTQYWGNVLAARSGLKSASQYRELLALSAASLDNKTGREWRTTEDTAVAGSLIRSGDQGWSNWRRSQDYYQEGELVWLDADTLIRKLTNNQKSLGDFAKMFLGKGGNTGPLIVPYEFPELVKTLNDVVPYDWAAFLTERIRTVQPRADLAGIERGGYRLVYRDQPSESAATLLKAKTRRGTGLLTWYSVGLRIDDTGKLVDVRWSSAADKAGMSPGGQVLAIAGKAYSAEAARNAIASTKFNTEPLQVTVQRDGDVRTFALDYHGGERFPTLERIEGTPALLDDITRPLTSAPAGQ